jgi:beta-ureidopropionase / N-carbamoyl-L-amino-acid hydrolase
MIFVPRRDGISHSVDEFTNDEDCSSGADVLLNTIVDLTPAWLTGRR